MCGHKEDNVVLSFITLFKKLIDIFDSKSLAVLKKKLKYDLNQINQIFLFHTNHDLISGYPHDKY
jgi:hypothetical protein